MIQISQMYIYPVKSCRGVAVTRSHLGPQGLENDRRWMIVDAQGQFMSQRQLPAMARIVATLPDARAEAASSAASPPAESAPPALSLQLADNDGSLHPTSPALRVEAITGSPSLPVQVWKDRFEAIDCGDNPAKFLSDFLGCPVRLVRFDDHRTRLCSPKWAGASGSHTRFADGYPVLVLGEASVRDLARRMGLEVLPLERFRPNIVISGLPAYEEDFVRTLELTPGDAAGIRLELVKPCPRCGIPSLNHLSGRPASGDPTAQLATFRYLPAVEGAPLGMNAIVLEGEAGGSAMGRTCLKTGQILNPIYHF